MIYNISRRYNLETGKKYTSNIQTKTYTYDPTKATNQELYLHLHLP